MPGDTLHVVARVDGAPGARVRLDVSIVVPPGITVVRGPSGAGKSTLLGAIAGLVRPVEGVIALGDVVLRDSARGIDVPPHERRVAWVQQSLALFPHLTALDNVAYGVRASSRAARHDEARRWLGLTRVEALAARMPSTLSGGEAQRVALARALASSPRALLLDEPFSALDAELRQTLAGELRALVDKLAIPTLFVTHDDNDARAVAAAEIALTAGRLTAQGLTAQRLTAQRLTAQREA